MTYLLGKKWQDFFDIVICQARKPSFFGAQKRFNKSFFCTNIYIKWNNIFSRPFREINSNNNSKSWDRVYKLQKGKVYVEVSFIL